MFYYGLDFHDLAPDSILHISSFIIVCEAFLHITPHFGLWLKTFNVKAKEIEGRHAECGGAAINRNTDVPWPEGSFRRCMICGNGGGFTSRLPEAQRGWLPLPSVRALRLNWRRGPMWDWTGCLLMTYRHCRAVFGSFLRGISILSESFR